MSDYLQERFLKLFGNPYIGLSPEKGHDKECEKMVGGKVWKIFQPMSVVREYNNNSPLAMIFTPNGNYGDLHSDGTKINIGLRDHNTGGKPHRNALFATLKCSDKGELFLSMKKTLESMGLGWEPTIITEEADGYTLYRVIKKEDKKVVHDSYGKVMTDLQLYMRTLFGNYAVETMGDLKDIGRIPYSMHGKFKTKAFLYEKDMTYLDIRYLNEEPQQKLKYISAAIIDVGIGYLREAVAVSRRYRDNLSSLGADYFSNINKLNFYDVINGLAKECPEDNIITIREDGCLYKGEEKIKGYRKAYDSDEIVRFCDVFFERPIGMLYQYIVSFFKGNQLKAQKYLSDMFGIEPPIVKDSAVEIDLWQYESDDAVLIGTTKKVYVKYSIPNSKGENKTVKKTLLKKRINIKGKTLSKSNGEFGETDHEVPALIIEVDGNTFLLKPIPNKREFNKAYIDKGLFFYGDDNDLGGIFDILFAQDIPVKESIYKSGIYDGFVYIGGNVVAGKMKKDIYEIPMHKVDVCSDLQQVTIEEYYDRLTEIFDKEVVMPAALGVMACACMNIREDVPSMLIYPGVQITGKSGSGKSTLGGLIKQMIGYKENIRKYALAGLSPQPFKHAATDYALLTLEEVTADIPKSSEQLVRNVLNHETMARGMPGGNIYYYPRAPILAMGERTFVETSINNRFITCLLNKKHQKGNTSKIIDLLQYTCYKDLYSRMLKNKKLLKSEYTRCDRMLNEAGLDSRSASVYASAMTMIRVLELPICQHEFIEYATLCSRKMGFGSPYVKEVGDSVSQFRSLIHKLLMKRKCAVLPSIEDANTTFKRFEIIIDDDEFEKNRALIQEIAEDINSRIKDDGGYRFTTMGKHILINVMLNNKTGEGKDVVDIGLLEGLAVLDTKKIKQNVPFL